MAGLGKWLLLLNALGLTVFTFGILAWGYTVAINVTHPEWLWVAFTHHTFWPLTLRLDDFGIVAFGAAALGFFAWALTSLLLRERRYRPDNAAT